MLTVIEANKFTVRTRRDPYMSYSLLFFFCDINGLLFFDHFHCVNFKTFKTIYYISETFLFSKFILSTIIITHANRQQYTF